MTTQKEYRITSGISKGQIVKIISASLIHAKVETLGGRRFTVAISDLELVASPATDETS